MNTCGNRRPRIVSGTTFLVVFTTFLIARTALGSGPKYGGSTACKVCHDPAQDEYARDFCLLGESSAFEEQRDPRFDPSGTDPSQLSPDPHRKAYRGVEGELSQRIMQRLREMDGAQWKSIEATRERQCLSCHINLRSDRLGSYDKRFYDHRFDGVSCEACHGPSELYDRPHRERDWRTKRPEEKEKLGMFDVRNPVKRAELCYSCHIGNAAQGKVLTHDMYEAGHPPLPGFELETFADRLPRHWRYLQEKGDFAFKREFVAANFPEKNLKQAERDLPRFKEVVFGAAVAYRESVRLIQSFAEQTERWPEFAVFDCASCHHSLRPNSWRRELASQPLGSVAPGRPTMPRWPTALMPLVIEQVDPGGQLETEFKSSLSSLNRALTQSPFGISTEIVAECKKVEAMLNRCIDALPSKDFDREAGDRARVALNTLTQAGVSDFHSQRQLRWAARMIKLDLELPEYPRFARHNRPAANKDDLLLRGIDDLQQWRAWKDNVLRCTKTKVFDNFDGKVLDERQTDKWLEMSSGFE